MNTIKIEDLLSSDQNIYDFDVADVGRYVVTLVDEYDGSDDAAWQVANESAKRVRTRLERAGFSVDVDLDDDDLGVVHITVQA